MRSIGGNLRMSFSLVSLLPFGVVQLLVFLLGYMGLDAMRRSIWSVKAIWVGVGEFT